MIPKHFVKDPISLNNIARAIHAIEARDQAAWAAIVRVPGSNLYYLPEIRRQASGKGKERCMTERGGDAWYAWLKAAETPELITLQTATPRKSPGRPPGIPENQVQVTVWVASRTARSLAKHGKANGLMRSSTTNR